MSNTLDLLRIQRDEASGSPSGSMIELELEGMGVSYVVDIDTTSSNPVTPYTEFLIRNIPADLKGKTVLDFGTGSGVLAIVASLAGASRSIAIDRNQNAIDLAKANAALNAATVEFFTSIDSVADDVRFDLILCNPASLPSKGGLESFFSSGVLGNDMIFEALSIAQRKLATDGEMRIVHTSLVPVHLTQARINQLQMQHHFLDVRELEFRRHYATLEPHFQAIRATHGIQYLERGSKKSELLFLVRVTNN